jgi:hypothetical protein
MKRKNGGRKMKAEKERIIDGQKSMKAGKNWRKDK